MPSLNSSAALRTIRSLSSAAGVDDKEEFVSFLRTFTFYRKTNNCLNKRKNIVIK